MFETILRQLTIWRNETAKREGVDGFRVLPNRVLEEIARLAPRTKAEMVGIKGIKEAKFAKYGREILGIIAADKPLESRAPAADINYFRQLSQERREGEKNAAGERVLSVGQYLDRLNSRLINESARIQGEVSSLDLREKVVYFSIKDQVDESLINCLVFRYQYETLGVKMEIGMEVVVEGYPEIYKPYGRLSLKVGVIELAGEGEIKKEYEKLKRKLEQEGFFEESRKKRFVELPQRIGLITSREGAAIGDFTSNIGQYGLEIRFVNSAVEGKRAVFELLGAIRTLRKTDIDALVIIRGGGSLESLQAFNNEALIREMSKVKVPVVCGVGHDRDVSLLSLACDYAVSTPTAAARLIGSAWEREIDRMDHLNRNVRESFEDHLRRVQRRRQDAARGIGQGFQSILRNTERRFEEFQAATGAVMENGIDGRKRQMAGFWQRIGYGMDAFFLNTRHALVNRESTLRLNDPERQLRLGYGIISRNGVAIRSVGEMHLEDVVRIRVIDGEAKAEIKGVNKLKK